MLPTGVTEFRQMWLEVTVINSKGEKIFSSGGKDVDGRLKDGTRIFQTVFGDIEGNPTINVAKAAIILTDRRIPPKGWIDETFRLKTPSKKPLTFNVELKYRSMDPKLVELLLGDSEIEVPIVTMARVEKTVE